tara:strand:+ start:926 stop:1513 length:588 start_codon:yes stop_codon:yes gene_type:complete
MIFKIKFFLTLVFCFFILLSCQKKLVIKEVVFDNSSLEKININSANKEIIISYNSSFEEPYIEHVMNISPTDRVVSWLENNIYTFGTLNKLVIDVQDASISQKEIDGEIEVAGIIKKQKEYLYEIFFKIEFILYDESNQVLAKTNTKVLHTKTSDTFISINEKESILDNLTLSALQDLSRKTYELLKIHMSDYIL